MDFEEYLQDRLLEIDNLEDRVIMRQIFESVLLPLNQYCDQKYDVLSEKVLNEKEDTTDYDIYTGLVERKKYDVTIPDMLPMIKEDLQEKKVNLTNLSAELAAGNDVKLFSVFFKLDSKQIKELASMDRKFHGVVQTEEGEFPAVFYIKRNQEYLNMLRDLYPVFLKNKVEWKTCCAPYLYKFFDVYICDGGDFAGEEIYEIIVDFEEYKDAALYDMVPLWNLETVKLNSSGYAQPCLDQIHYEYTIFKEKLGEDNYLVMNSDIEITNQRRVDGDLIVTCDVSESIPWKLLQFHKLESKRFRFPVFGNTSSDLPTSTIRTLAAIEKLVQAFGYEEYLKLRDIKVEVVRLDSACEYHVDEVLLEERMLQVTPHEKRNVLWLIFEKTGEEQFYLGDIMNYLVTRVQWYYPEYCCIGKFQ